MADATDPAPSDSAASDLVAHARETHVVVIGGGLAGAVVALECAKIGMRVTLLEAKDRLGGALLPTDLGGVTVDLLADGFPSGAPELDGILEELGLTGRVEPFTRVPAWISGVGPRAADAIAVPEEAVLGIPANPWDADVRRVIGWGGAWRAYVDRLRPPLTIGRERNLGVLVSTRMGDRVRDRLVAPVTRATLGLEPGEVDVEAVAPKLNAALTSTGSLAGAAGALAGPESARCTLAGGLHVLADALAEHLLTYDVDLRTGSRVDRLSRDADGWALHAVSANAGAAAAGDADAEAGEEAGEVRADVVVVAVPENAARALLDGLVELPRPAVARRLQVVALRVCSVAPDRSDAFPIPGGADAWRVTDLTAVDPSLAAALPAGERVIRVVGPATTAAAPDAIAAARVAASEALGLALAPSDVIAAASAEYTSAARSRIGHEERVGAVRDAVHGVTELAVAGAWVSGDGLDRVVADAVAEAARIRREVLWGGVDRTIV